MIWTQSSPGLLGRALWADPCEPPDPRRSSWGPWWFLKQRTALAIVAIWGAAGSVMTILVQQMCNAIWVVNVDRNEGTVHKWWLHLKWKVTPGCITNYVEYGFSCDLCTTPCYGSILLRWSEFIASALQLDIRLNVQCNYISRANSKLS